MYGLLEELGFTQTELYKLDLKELRELLVNRRKGLAYELWKSMVLNRFILATKPKEIPQSPEDACPELYPPKKSYKMPEFLVEKYEKRKNGTVPTDTL